MNGLTSTYSKLQNPQIPLKERIELSRNVLQNNECFLPNKTQVLADWLCQELHHVRVLLAKKEGEASLDLRKNKTELWKVLHEVLKSPMSEHIVFRQRFLPVLSGELATLRSCLQNDGGVFDETVYSCAVSVFLCCEAMFQNAQVSLILFNKLDSIEQCLKEVLSCFLAILLQPSLKSANLIQELSPLVTVVLQHYGTIQRQQVTQRKVFINLCEKLLHLLLMVKSCINDENSLLDKHNLGDTNKAEIISKIDAVIAAGLFHKDHLMSYTTTMDNTEAEEPVPKKPKKSSYTNQLFEVLRSSLGHTSLEGKVLAEGQVISDTWVQSVYQSLPFILKSFLEAAKDEQKLERSTKFSFFIELYGIISLTEESGTDKDGSEVERIRILNQMLKVLLDYDVYQIAEDNVNNQPVFNWLVNLTKSLMQSQQDCDVFLFQSLDTLLKLNHKIVEQFLDQIIGRCLSKSQQNSEQVEQEKAKVFCSLVETYSRLHQMEHLVKCMLNVIKGSDKDLGVIPVEVNTKFAQAFEHCPLNLTLSLYQIFLDEIKGQVECLKQFSSKDGSLQEGFNGSAMEVMTVLFVTFLCNSSYNASDQHGLDANKVNLLRECIEATEVSVVVPLIKAFPKCQKSCQKEIGFSALYLLYGLKKVTSYLSHHDIVSDNVGVHISWNSELGTFSPDCSWNGIEIVTKNGCLKFCIDLLVVQRARCLLVSRNPDREELSCIVNFLFNFKPSHPNPKSVLCSWNGDPCCVTNKNYPAAHWSLVAQHAALLLPYCDESQVCGFARYFIRTLSSHDEESPQDHLRTVNQTSRRLLEMDELHALPSLQVAVIKALWQLVGESTGDKFPKLSNIFSWNSLDKSLHESRDSERDVSLDNSVVATQDSQNQEMDIQETKEGATPKCLGGNKVESTTTEMHHAALLAQDLAELMNTEAKKMTKKRLKKEKVSIKDTKDLRDIENLLKVLQRLPCSSFTPGNQVRCILGLLACDIPAGRQITPDAQSLAITLSCRRSLITLLQASLQNLEFAAWRVVDMEALFNWVYATMVRRDRAFGESLSELQSKFGTASKALLELAVKLGLKSGRHTSLVAIGRFTDQLLASVNGSTGGIAVPKLKTLEVLFTVVCACVETLEEKSIRKSSSRMATDVVVKVAVPVVNLANLFLKDGDGVGLNDERNVNLETLILKLSGIITRALSLMPESKATESSDIHERLGEWGQIVALTVTRIMQKLDNIDTRDTHAVTYVTILEDICQCDQKYREVLPEEFQTWVLRTCLRILTTCELFSGKEIEEGSDEERRKLGEVTLGLFSTMLEADEGENCTAILETVVELSVIEIDEEPSLKLLTGLSVLKSLLGKKVVKKRRKGLRASFGKVLVTLLNRATADIEVLTIVLEIIAAVVTLGSRSLYPQDISFVFQALALARDLEVNDLRLFSRLFTARFNILSWTLFYYPDHVYGIIHVFLPCVRDLLSGLLAQGLKASTESGSTTILAGCAEKMSRLYQELTSHKDVLSKYSIYFLADCIHQLSTQGMPGCIRDTLVQGVHYLFDVCNEESLTKVHIYLLNTERELFRSLNEDFTKHHKFKGNA